MTRQWDVKLVYNTVKYVKCVNSNKKYQFKINLYFHLIHIKYKVIEMRKSMESNNENCIQLL